MAIHGMEILCYLCCLSNWLTKKIILFFLAESGFYRIRCIILQHWPTQFDLFIKFVHFAYPYLQVFVLNSGDGKYKKLLQVSTGGMVP